MLPLLSSPCTKSGGMAAALQISPLRGSNSVLRYVGN